MTWYEVPEARKKDMASRLPEFEQEIMSISGKCTIGPLHPDLIQKMPRTHVLKGCFVWEREERGHAFWSDIQKRIDATQ